MPLHDQINARKQTYSSHSRVLAYFKEDSATTSVAERQGKYNIAFRDQESFNELLRMSDSHAYQNYAGCDIAAFLTPFRTFAGPTGSGMPCFDSTFAGSGNYISSGIINSHDLLPFRWDPKESGYIYDRYMTPSGDSIGSVISDTQTNDDIDRYRDISNIRTLGLRLPAVGVGWGFTLDGTPWPSGGVVNGRRMFKNNLSNGYDLDPSDYVAAPIDIRYDQTRNVWSAFGTAGSGDNSFYAIISGTLSTSPFVYSWAEAVPNINGIFYEKTGIHQIAISSVSGAREINNRYVTNQTTVRMRPVAISSSGQIFEFESNVPRGQNGSTASFPVVLHQTGGIDASVASGTLATWTYTVKDWVDTETLGTNKSPLYPRQFICPTSQATKGEAFYDSSGSLQLLNCNEVYTPTTVDVITAVSLGWDSIAHKLVLNTTSKSITVINSITLSDTSGSQQFYDCNGGT